MLMGCNRKLEALVIVCFLLLVCCEPHRHYTFEVREAFYTRLCSSKRILTVNGQFPGPPIYAHKGESFWVNVINKSSKNVTIHWHGVKQPRYPWSDGPEYITQCPIRPGSHFRQKVVLSTEEGTLLWHAHSDLDRATVHGPIIIYPKINAGCCRYPFRHPHAEVPIILGEWWKAGIEQLYDRLVATGGDLNVSDTNTINGQPGDLYPCSSNETFVMRVEARKTYLLRIVSATMQDIMFFGIANHSLTVVGIDASYTKPYTTKYIAISPGQTIDALLHTDQPPAQYYMASRVYNGGADNIDINNTTATAILRYASSSAPPSALPSLPNFTDVSSTLSFTSGLKSLNDKAHPIEVPHKIDESMFVVLSINTFPCKNNSCAGPNGTRLAASANNYSFVNPTTDILQAYYRRRNGAVYDPTFPNIPRVFFNFTADSFPRYLLTPKRATKVKLLRYNATVEIVFQGTNLVAGTDHPMHLHGSSFYVVGRGLGNFDSKNDRSSFNVVDPPLQNSVAVPVSGWAAVRFKAHNPGVWLMHCHIDRHMVWGMDYVFIVEDGPTPLTKMIPPPSNMPQC